MLIEIYSRFLKIEFLNATNETDILTIFLYKKKQLKNKKIK